MPNNMDSSLGPNSIQNQNGTKLRIKKFQGPGGVSTILGSQQASESSKLKLAGAATLQRNRESNNNSELSLIKKQAQSASTNKNGLVDGSTGSLSKGNGGFNE
jgi:hypothetical protein